MTRSATLASVTVTAVGVTAGFFAVAAFGVLAAIAAATVSSATLIAKVPMCAVRRVARILLDITTLPNRREREAWRRPHPNDPPSALAAQHASSCDPHAASPS